jgi:hypothetical protein
VEVGDRKWGQEVGDRRWGTGGGGQEVGGQEVGGQEVGGRRWGQEVGAGGGGQEVGAHGRHTINKIELCLTCFSYPVAITVFLALNLCKDPSSKHNAITPAQRPCSINRSNAKYSTK